MTDEQITKLCELRGILRGAKRFAEIRVQTSAECRADASDDGDFCFHDGTHFANQQAVEQATRILNEFNQLFGHLLPREPNP